MDISILNSTKKKLGLSEDYTAFDQDVIDFINGIFVTLNDLGVGPESGFMIEDASSTWVDFLGLDPRQNSVKNYVYLRARMLFDPPTIGYLVEAMDRQIKELEWRINTRRENTQWVPPEPVDPEPEVILDGGSA